MSENYRTHYLNQQSWQSKVLRGLVPLVVSTRFGSSRTAEPDVARLRARANRASLPGRMWSRLRYPKIEHVSDAALDAEWTWRRQDEPIYDDRNCDPLSKVVLYLHGGAYYFGSPATHRALIAELASASGAVVLAPDYRLAPEHPFPAALDDAIHAYHGLLARGVSPRSIVFAGDSAGGGLALSAMMRLRDLGDPLPAGAMIFSPWVDLASNGQATSGGPGMNIVAMETAAQMYLGDASRFDPHASPSRGSLRGLPPVHIHVSDSEALYSQSIDLEARLRRSGVPVEMFVWKSMPHAWHCFAPMLPEARAALRVAAEFVRRRVRV